MIYSVERHLLARREEPKIMCLSLSLNGDSRYIASLQGPGYLSAHLNMQDRPKENDRSRNVRIQGTETAESETIWSKWPTLELSVGDVVELRILPGHGEGEAPIEVRKSSESPSNLFSHIELAKELLQIVSDCDSRLMELLSKSETTEPTDEHKKISRAVASVVYEHGAQFLYPIFRRHKSLIPGELKGELL
jgi:hypothetical protein